jgi:predicted ester cyclase
MPMESITDPALRARREKIVLDHFADEVSQDFDKVLSTFPHPHYELIPQGIVHDGREDVMRYYLDTRKAFPDQRHEMIALRHSEDAVITEFWLLGTHKGYLGEIPPTGNSFRVRMNAFFIFEGERLVCERIYFDAFSMLRQLIGKVDWKRPSEILRLLRTLRGALRMSKTAG